MKCNLVLYAFLHDLLSPTKLRNRRGELHHFLIPMSRSRIYADVIASKPENYCDYEDVKVDWGYGLERSPHGSRSLERYELIASVGRGKFSEVFKATDRQSGEYVSIKHLKPIRRKKIQR